jgi:hypothetical protein
MINLATKRTLSPLGAAIALSIALMALFVICAVVELVWPGLPAAHAWISLFTIAPVASAQAWMEGLFFSLAMGIIVGTIFAVVHNAVAAKGL